MIDTIEKTSGTSAALRAIDRCETKDCSAQAFVLVEVPVSSSESPLDIRYCGHHYNKHSAGLAGAGARVITDNRHMINSKPTDPKDSEGF